MIITITNIDGVVKTFNADESFIEYAKLIFHENEGTENEANLTEPTTVTTGIVYINEFCDNLHLSFID